jgi:hypothetical protein
MLIKPYLSNREHFSSYTHGGELCIISSHRICEEHMGTALLGASSTEMMQDFPLRVLAHAIVARRFNANHTMRGEHLIGK